MSSLNFVQELKARGMIHDIMPGTEEQLNKEMTTAYVGIDPTADSLHIGHLVSIMMLKHLQVAGHRPLALIGGATGMIGDPSGKSEERNLLSEELLHHNQQCIKNQLLKFLDFDTAKPNCAEIVNNYDWMKAFSFLGFLRDVGKHLSVNYMMAKDSVKKRLETGISFTEFSYQLLQGYDFLHLHETKNCKLQMGGSDQWGNITTGTELIRRKTGGEAFALTCPLITKADGKKFGKTEQGNVWLDCDKTSPYQFYQFWLNVSDEDAAKFIKIFTLLPLEQIADLERQHAEAPHLRLLQKVLAEDITTRVHSEADLLAAQEASDILFGKGTEATLRKLDEATLLSVFEGVPNIIVKKEDVQACGNATDLLAVIPGQEIFPSKTEARKMISAGAVSINKAKTEDPNTMPVFSPLHGKYLVVQKGKKNYYLMIME